MVLVSSKELDMGTLGPSWESPYYIKEELHTRTYTIENLGGKSQPHPWNEEHRRRYKNYQSMYNLLNLMKTTLFNSSQKTNAFHWQK